MLYSRVDERLLFAIPRAGLTWIGTTDTDYQGDPADARATPADVDTFRVGSPRLPQPAAGGCPVHDGGRRHSPAAGQGIVCVTHAQGHGGSPGRTAGVISVLGGRLPATARSPKKSPMRSAAGWARNGRRRPRRPRCRARNRATPGIWAGRVLSYNFTARARRTSSRWRCRRGLIAALAEVSGHRGAGNLLGAFRALRQAVRLLAATNPLGGISGSRSGCRGGRGPAHGVGAKWDGARLATELDGIVAMSPRRSHSRKTHDHTYCMSRRSHGD